MQKRSFGKTKDGKEVFLFSMENKNGVKAEVTNFGAILVNLFVPDKNGKAEDIVLGFDDVSGLLSDLATYGYVTGAYMGVRVSDMEASAATYYGLPLGAYVQSVDDGGAAQRAGIRSKDIIVKLGDYEVGSVNDLTRALRNFKGGDVTTVIVYRSGAEVRLTITLDEKPVPQT